MLREKMNGPFDLISHPHYLLQIGSNCGAGAKLAKCKSHKGWRLVRMSFARQSIKNLKY
jgi:hypothetical protein